MQGMQGVNSERALSKGIRYNEGFEGIYDRMPRGDWSMPVKDRAIQRVECEDPRDVMILRTMFPGYIKEDTPVFRLENGKKVTRIGSVASVSANTAIREVKANEISDTVDDEVIELTDADIVEDLNIEENIVTRCIYCPAEHHELLATRKELGLSVDYFTRKDKKGERQDFRYRQRQKEGVAGTWVSKKYVSEAVDALHEYDRCMKSGSVHDLKVAVGIAKRYFTNEAQAEAKYRIVKRTYDVLIRRGDMKSLSTAAMLATRYLRGNESTTAVNYVNLCRRKEAVRLVGDAKQGKLDHDTGKHVFAQLVRMDDPDRIAEAVDIARIYISEEVAEKTAVHLNNVIELKRRKEASGIRRRPLSDSDVRARPRQIPALPPRPPVPKSQQNVLRPILPAYGASAA